VRTCRRGNRRAHEWKQALYQRITPHLGATAILVNTSGLSVNALAATLLCAAGAFCGVHFFNPAIDGPWN
jgi:3-hydroxyacyl-CoA dehydrogenase